MFAFGKVDKLKTKSPVQLPQVAAAVAICDVCALLKQDAIGP